MIMNFSIAFSTSDTAINTNQVSVVFAAKWTI